jgi:ferredoxin
MGDCAELAARSRGARVPADAARLLEASFDSPQWEEIARTCLGCSVCTYVCPSCTCFDVVDEGSAACGSRCRTWDSCSYAMFTKHGGGHNPRASQTQRFRQRVLHKFAYFPEKHGGLSMCVGCGRCVRSCPVGLDIQSTVGAVLRRAAQTKADEETTDVDHHA